jgi:hypothetical protein
MLIEQAPTAPLMLVATYRPELTPPWPQRSHMTPITLNRLDEVSTARSGGLPTFAVTHRGVRVAPKPAIRGTR